MAILLGTLAATAAPGISKEQQEICKTLKKTLNAKSVEVFASAPDAPYYICYTKDGKFGIVDKCGNIIAEPRYEDVMYFPAYSGNTVTVPMVNDKYKPTGRTVTLITQPSAEGFWGCSARGIDLISRQGTVIKSFTQIQGKSVGNYIYLCPGSFPIMYEQKPNDKGVSQFDMLSLLRGKGKGYGILLRTDGTEVIPNVDWLTFCDHDPCAVYEIVTDNGTTLQGMKRLDGCGFDIPAEFYRIYKGSSNDQWRVQARATDPHAIDYEPSTKYDTKMRDMGEELYAQSKYDDVLDYYAKEGIDAPWAKFYSAEALYHRWGMASLKLRAAVEAMEKGSGLPDNETNLLEQANAMVQSYNMAVQLFNAYLATGDTSFAKEARNDIELVNYSIAETNENLARYRKVRGRAAQVTSAEQAQQQAQLQAILGIFTHALSGISSSSSSTRTSGSVSSPAHSASGSSSTSSSTATDNSGRKAFLRNQITDWKNKLKKAEASLEREIASGEDTPAKKRLVESKRNTVNECLNMIRQYESELNSLK